MRAMWYSGCAIPTCKRHPSDFYASCAADPVKNKDWQGLTEAIVDDAHPEVERFWDDHAELIQDNVAVADDEADDEAVDEADDEEGDSSESRAI